MRFFRYCLLVVLFVFGQAAAFGTVLTFGSHASSANVVGDAVTSDHGLLQSIVPNAVWYGPLSGTSWTSPWNSGATNAPGFYSPPNGEMVRFFHTITLPDNFVIDSAVLQFLADDTATGYLGVTPIFDPNLGQGVNCAAGAPGCLVSTLYTGNLAAGLFQPGNNTFSFDVEQRYGSSFGADWKLDISGHEVPEPATFGLIGAGLIGLAGLVRRKQKNN